MKISRLGEHASSGKLLVWLYANQNFRCLQPAGSTSWKASLSSVLNTDKRKAISELKSLHPKQAFDQHRIYNLCNTFFVVREAILHDDEINIMKYCSLELFDFWKEQKMLKVQAKDGVEGWGAEEMKGDITGGEVLEGSSCFKDCAR